MSYWNGWRSGWPKRKKDCAGRWVRTRRKMATGMMGIPAGTLMRIRDGGGGGLSLRSEACRCCGVEAYIRGVLPRDLELMLEGFEPSPRCRKCNAEYEFKNDEWVCPTCGHTEMDHGDHPDRP